MASSDKTTATSQDSHAAPRTRAKELVSWALYDWANSAFSAIISTFVFAAYFTRHVAANEIEGTSQWGYTIGLAGIVIAVTAPVMGAIADQAGGRKPWVALFTAVCVIPTALMWYVKPSPDYVPLALALVAVATVGVEIASVFYNAMLPHLAPPRSIGRWSGWGWGLGYAGGVASLVIALFIFIEDRGPFAFDRSNAEQVRATFVLVAAWYTLFALPLFAVCPDTPRSGTGMARAVGDGLRQLADTIRHVRRYRSIVRFLIARMFFIDGLATLFTFGGVYAAGTFDMSEQQVLTFGLVLNVTAGIGAAAFAWVDDWLGSKTTIQLSLIGLIISGTATLLVTSQTAFWVLGSVLGIFVGPVQAAGRSYLARVAPVAMRTQMFGLLALSGKATAFLGPILVGLVTGAAGSQRVGMGVIIALFGAGLILMAGVPSAKEARHVDGKVEGRGG